MNIHIEYRVLHVSSHKFQWEYTDRQLYAAENYFAKLVFWVVWQRGRKSCTLSGRSFFPKKHTGHAA